LKRDAAVFILPARGLEIEIRKGNFAGVSGREVKESLADDSVVSDFQLASVLEYEKGRCLRRVGSRNGDVPSLARVRWGNVPYWRDIGIGARSSAVEDGGTALIVVIRAVVGVILGCAHVDGIRNRDGVDKGKAIFGTVTAVRAAVVVARHV
jgi:hypothetical protein